MADTADPMLARRIASPADFPVTWEQPGDEALLWTRDRVHYPAPIAPLAFEVADLTIAHGMSAAQQVYEGGTRVHSRRINTYYYRAVEPVSTTEAARAAAQARLADAVARLGELWETEWLPEVQQYLAQWEAFDHQAATLPVLLAHLDDRIKGYQRLWVIHFLAVRPAYDAMSQFDELYHELFGEADAFAPFRLLEGFDNASLAADRQLYRLSQLARATPAVREVLLRQPAEQVITALEHSEAAGEFLAVLRDYLATSGRRHITAVTSGGWDEQPELAVKAIQEYLRQPERDPEAELAAAAAERVRLIAEARGRLAGYPRPVVEQFEAALRSAQAGMIVSEDHNFWIDQQARWHVRQLLLELGRRLAAAGAIDDRDDIFFLTLDEIRATARSTTALDRRGLVAVRQAEMAHFRMVTPPTELGTRPAAPPADSTSRRARDKMFGTAVGVADEPDMLYGHAGSPGVVRGPARVLTSLAEAGKLRPGDILVAPTTLPPWSPLFAIAAAVVTDAGGILSHCAVVAREYRIPAVVGTGTATIMLQDDQLIEVDGNIGRVRILPPV